MYGIYHKLYVNDAYLSALDEWQLIPPKESISTAELAYRWIVFNSALKPEFGDRVVQGASSLDQLERTLRFFDQGSLSEQAVRRIDGIWENVKHVPGVDNYQAVMG
jgi:aryl-alcohol dehydrogenase-like predicted oxidoreductase